MCGRNEESTKLMIPRTPQIYGETVYFRSCFSMALIALIVCFFVVRLYSFSQGNTPSLGTADYRLACWVAFKMEYECSVANWNAYLPNFCDSICIIAAKKCRQYRIKNDEQTNVFVNSC